MTPIELKDCVRRNLRLKFKEEPPYDDILNCLNRCYEEHMQYYDFGPNRKGSDYSELINWYPFDWDKSSAVDLIKK